MPSIPNAVSEKLNTNMFFKPCGCVIHTKNVNGEILPIEKYYGVWHGELKLLETSKCQRHANISFENLHSTIQEEEQRLSNARGILIEHLEENEKVNIVDDETGDSYDEIKNGISYSFDENGVLVIQHATQNKAVIQDAWDSIIGANKVKFYGE